MARDTTKFEGRLTFGSFTGSHSGGSFRLEDAKSGTPVLEMTITAEALGALMLNHSRQPVEVELWPADLIGKRHEHRRVKLNLAGHRTIEAVRFAAEALEVDGWKASLDSSFNWHRLDGDDYEVWFHRYVDDEEA